MLSQDLTVRIEHGLQGLNAVEATWRNLASRQQHAGYQHLPFCYRTLLEARDEGETLAVASVTDRQGNTLAIVPLQVRRERIRGVYFRAWDFPIDHDRPATDIICPDLSIADRLPMPLSEALRQICPPVSLMAFNRVEEGSALWRLVKATNTENTSFYRSGEVFRISVEESFNTLVSSVSQKFRANLRRGWREIAARGGVEHECATERTDVERCWQEFLCLEARGWKGTGTDGNAISRRPDALLISSAYLREAASQGACEIHVLRSAQRSVAALIALRGPAEMHMLKIAYDEATARASPAHLLIERCLSRWCADSTITAVNGGPEAAWFRPWRPVVAPLWSVYVGIDRLKSRLAFALLRLPSSAEVFGTMK